MDHRTELVRRGYDQIWDVYANWQPDGGDVRRPYVDRLLSELPRGSSVLDLGCGTGAHATSAFVPEHDVVGVDLSLPSLTDARSSLGRASFVCADIGSVAFAPQSLDAVVALFSLIHVPRDEHAIVLARIATWLRPGGWFVASMGAGDGTESVGEFLGVEMFWSSWSADTNVALVRDAGLDVVSAREETEEEDGRPVTHLWVVARRPTAPNRSSRQRGSGDCANTPGSTVM